VLGIVLAVVKSGDDKPRLPKFREASFGDEVLITDNSVGCPTEEVYEKWLNTVLEKGDGTALKAAVQGGCQLVNSDTAGEPDCLWIIDSRLSVTNPSSSH
jgi:hypothetical protein